ncbi:MAG TPA: ABC transporter permease [Spirochaetia bacterium]|nr:ABC transporter permease [Spirochaetia bacterium]
MNTKRTNNVTLLILFVLVTGLMAAFLPTEFMSLRNLRNMGRQLPEYGLLALANMLAMITGGIDLSVVSITSLSGVVAASILSQYSTIALPAGVTILLAIVAALSVAAMCGAFNGILVAYAGIPAIIATLGTNGLFLGIAIIITKGHGIIGFPPAFEFFGNGRIAGVPTQFVIFIAVALLLGLLLNRTSQGFRMYMYGSNPLVSRFSGVNNEMVLIKTYIISAILAGIAAIIIISGVNSVRPGYGTDYLLLSVLIAILGGTDPTGGFGTVLGVSLAIFIVQALQSGLNILGFSPFFKKSSWGLLLLLIMVFHFYRSRYQLKKISRAKVPAGPGESTSAPLPSETPTGDDAGV